MESNGLGKGCTFTGTFELISVASQLRTTGKSESAYGAGSQPQRRTSMVSSQSSEGSHPFAAFPMHGGTLSEMGGPTLAAVNGAALSSPLASRWTLSSSLLSLRWRKLAL